MSPHRREGGADSWRHPWAGFDLLCAVVQSQDALRLAPKLVELTLALPAETPRVPVVPVARLVKGLPGAALVVQALITNRKEIQIACRGRVTGEQTAAQRVDRQFPLAAPRMGGPQRIEIAGPAGIEAYGPT